MVMAQIVRFLLPTLDNPVIGGIREERIIPGRRKNIHRSKVLGILVGEIWSSLLKI